MVVLLCPVVRHVGHLKWLLTKYFGNHEDILHIYAEMAIDGCTEMQPEFQDSQNPAVFISTPSVSRTGINLTAANYAVMTLKIQKLSEQRQTFA